MTVNEATLKHLGFVVGTEWRRRLNEAAEAINEPALRAGKRKEKPDFSSFSRFGGLYWTRTSDPQTL